MQQQFCAYSDQDAPIYLIFVILFNTQISFGNVKGRMVIDEHNYNRVSPLQGLTLL